MGLGMAGGPTVSTCTGHHAWAQQRVSNQGLQCCHSRARWEAMVAGGSGGRGAHTHGSGQGSGFRVGAMGRLGTTQSFSFLYLWNSLTSEAFSFVLCLLLRFFPCPHNKYCGVWAKYSSHLITIWFPFIITYPFEFPFSGCKP